LKPHVDLLTTDSGRAAGQVEVDRLAGGQVEVGRLVGAALEVD